MPVPTAETTPATLQDVLQERLLGGGSFKQIESYLASVKTKNGRSMNCTSSIITDMMAILQQESKSHNFTNIKTLLCCIQHIANGPSNDLGLPVLLENGLFDLLEYAYNIVMEGNCSHTHTSSPPTADDACFIQLLETMNDVADHSSSTKEKISQIFAEKLMAFIVNSQRHFATRMEAIRTLNLLLEGCSSQCLSDLRNNQVEKLLEEFAEFLARAGDFEMQVACTETLARFIKKSEREAFSEKCFPNEAVAGSFLNIRDACFEVDCRKFLNAINESQRNERGVFSLPCVKAFLGQYRLKCPQDDNLVDFWVDFNSVSRSITIYVAEEGATSEETGMWETVTLQEDQVRYVDIKKFGDLQHLNISLTVPVSQILPFCRSSSQAALIIFHPHHDLLLPLASCYGPEKMLAQNKVRRKSSECTIKVLFSRIGENGAIHTENFYGKGGVKDKTSYKKESAQSGSGAVPVRKKISAPLNPMTSPPRQSSKDRGNCSSNITRKPADSTPKTPKQQPSKRAKTPLNVSVSDKPSSTGGNDRERIETGTSHKKESAGSTTTSRSASPSQTRVGRGPGDKDLSDCDDGITVEGCTAESREKENQKSGEKTDRKSGENGMKGCKTNREMVLFSKQNVASSDEVQKTDEEGQIPSSHQIVPESQYSQMVVEETQEGDVPDSHQASESPLESSQSASQGRRKGRRKSRQQMKRSAGNQRKNRKSPRLQALEEMSALNPGKEKHSKSGKFRLYSEGEGLVRGSVTPGDIIPSSCPSQDSMADFVPDSCPVTTSRNKKSTRRKSSSRPGLVDIPEKPTESTDSSEMEHKKRGQTKPRRRKSGRAPTKSKSFKKEKKSKKFTHEENEDDTSSVSSTLHQTREFLSQSLPVLPPSQNCNEDGDPYLFSDINDGSAKVEDTGKKGVKEKLVKVTKHKRNLNKPDKSSFLNKKSFMSFPSKSLTLPVVGSEPGRKKGLSQSMIEGKTGDVDGKGDGHTAGTKKEEADRSGQRVKGNRRGRACKKMERQPPVSSDIKGRQEKRGESKKSHDTGFEEEMVSSEKEKLKGKGKEKLISDEDHHMNRGISESSDENERSGRKGDKDENSFLKGKVSDADVSFASREMRDLSDVEVMRDAAHLEEDFQDDDIHGLIQSVKKFLERPRENVTGKPTHGGSSPRKEAILKKEEEDGENLQEKESGRERVRKDRARERKRSTTGENVEGDNRQEVQDIDGIEREAEKLEEGKEYESEMSFSDDGDAMEEINKELRALSKELQETGKRKKQHQQLLGEKYEENLTGESKKKGEKEVLKTPSGASRYGSDIEDEDEVKSNLSLDFDDKKTEASVQSFSRICKSIVYQSGDGIAKNRSRRDLPKVDYRDQDVSFSDEEYVPSLDTRPFNTSSDSQYDTNGEGYTSNTSRRTSGYTDLQSERSWLVEKSHIKVSTYSKVQRKRWAKERQGEDVFKTIKKGSHRKQTEGQKRLVSPENVALELLAPKKKKKNIAEDDDAIDFLYYQQDSKQSHPASQERLIQKISSRVQREDQGVTPSSYHTSKSSGKIKLQATGVTPRSSITSKSSKKTKIRDISSDHDEVTNDLIEPLSQDILEFQTTPGCGMTPQVKIGEDEEIQSDVDDPDARQMLLSGPSKMSTITQSSLKRKYEHMIEDITRSDDENDPGEDSLEEEDAGEIDEGFKPPMVRRSINPRRLFENELLTQGKTGLHADHKSVHEDGDNTSATASSSSSNLSWNNPSDYHIPEMVAIVGQKIQRQFAEKRNQTRAITDSVLKSTQKYLSKIWAEQNHGRQAALEEFRESLLKEIVALEIDVENLNKTSSKLQAMAQRRLKTGVEMNSRHAMHIRSLHQSYIQELNEMDLYLEEHLKKSVKTIVEQEFGSLKQKLLNDLHAQDVSQMKRALQSYFSL